MIFQNSYEDAVRAASYSRLEFPNTYFLAYRDLPSIIGRYLSGGRALDFDAVRVAQPGFCLVWGFRFPEWIFQPKWFHWQRLQTLPVIIR
jgi:hypothetical protein